ncbi:MAG: indole-3-glycerol phosphate synthase TrpC [Syntrophomonadaceae bacterium]|nr:indole-3-glycerol phosphate synthase TrpC [Syntrophomonadaceae bacterium]
MLAQIVDAKRAELAGKSDAILEEFYSTDCLPALRDFTGIFAIDNRVSLIAEIKRGSPVKGVFLAGVELADLAVVYERNGARAISVITEQNYFGGNPGLIRQVREQAELPVLRKDFIIDECQVYESRLMGADAVLLIARLLPGRLLRFVELACHLGLEPLVEVHDRAELEEALDTPVRVIGINNRDLKDFTVDLRVSLDLIPLVPERIHCIAASGIRSRQDMKTLEENGFRGALVGEALVTARDIGARVRELAGYYEGAGYDQG